MKAPGLVEHFFRHEYGRLVSLLVGRFGMACLEAVEDAVQAALMAALETWPRAGVPDEPAAWLFRVAHNRLVGDLRADSRRRRLLAESGRAAGPAGPVATDPEPGLAGEVADGMLRMLLVCCDEAIPRMSQLVLALKTLCGFDVREIALRLFTSEANVYKRLARARRRLRERGPLLDDLEGLPVRARLPAVRQVLYLMFTEGYLSCRADAAIRRELCADALRLAIIVAEHPAGEDPESEALVALMHLHAARMTARQDAAGGLILLEDQDRSSWDQGQIQRGLGWLARSARGARFSRFHAEAGIAAEHCRAGSFQETRWDRIAACYALLERHAPSPLHTLNRAVALAECQGPAAGLAVVASLQPPRWLAESYLHAAVLADLHRRCGHAAEAARHGAMALQRAPSPAIAALLRRRLGVYGP